MEIKRESSEQKLKRKSKNAWIRFKGFCKSSNSIAKKKSTQVRIKARKREFGVQYMDLVEKGESTEELSQCLSEAQKDLDSMRITVKNLDDKIQLIKQKTKESLVESPLSERSSRILVDSDVSSPPAPTFAVITGVAEDACKQEASVPVSEDVHPSPSAPAEDS